MTSRERLLSVLRGAPVDRVPISTYELVGWNPDSWENREPSYRGLMEFIREHTDCIYMWNGGSWGIDPGLLEITSWEDGGDRYTKTVCRARARLLTSLKRETLYIRTVWEVERLLKGEDDARAFLELPLALEPPDPCEFDRRAAGLGEKGIMMHSVSDALCVAAELFSFSTFLVLCLTRMRLIRELMDKIQEYVLRHLESMLLAGFGPLFRICGPEYATPPYLPPEFFRELVVAYDRPLVDMIHRFGRFARLHCHGKIARVLDAILELEPDGLDPVEPPPDGDITLAEAKRRTAGRLAIFGNLELKHLEHGTPEEVEAITRLALAEGKPGGRFVLMPTAAPIGIPLGPRTEANYRRFIETARSLGAY